MTSDELRYKFLDFFKKRGHTIVPSSSLIPTDPSVLLTTAGMQQFKPYYLGEKSPYGNKTASVQKCFRTSDIEEVGDESHLTFFEMLGNFSFAGEYFKKEAIEYAYEFITKELGLKIDYVSIFGGEGELPEDKESEKAWRETASNLEIKKFGKEDNFWGPTGEEGPCGPTAEIYINGIEIWNLVFNEYYKSKEGNYEKLKKPGVDTGMGLERLAMIVQKKNNIFETDLFEKIMAAGKNDRVAADHLRASVFLIADGIRPSNLDRGYILRRLIRRVVARKFDNESILNIATIVIDNYKDFYPELEKLKNNILDEIEKESNAFRRTLQKGLRQFEKIEKAKESSLGKKISGKDAFLLFSTYGFPLEMTQEIAKEKGMEVDVDGFRKEMENHQKLSRSASAGMFKGGLTETNEQTAKLHTATHLLLAALRKVLGPGVKQRGSNITPERLRLDFSYGEKLTEEQKKKIEKLVNEKIKENLPVKCEEMSLEEAGKSDALGEFGHKYGKKVKVYSINDFSREICGGPHAERTGELGEFKIKKEESVGAGIRRIKAVIL